MVVEQLEAEKPANTEKEAERCRGSCCYVFGSDQWKDRSEIDVYGQQLQEQCGEE